MLLQCGSLAAHGEQRRRVIDGRELRRIFVLAKGEECDPHPVGCRKLPLRVLARANPHRSPGAAAPGKIGQRFKCGAGAAAVIDERAKGARTDVLGTDEAEPVKALGGG